MQHTTSSPVTPKSASLTAPRLETNRFPTHDEEEDDSIDDESDHDCDDDDDNSEEKEDNLFMINDNFN